MEQFEEGLEKIEEGLQLVGANWSELVHVGQSC